MHNFLKIFSGFLLFWYGILRWILLDKSNNSWVYNNFGNIVAFISIVFILNFLYIQIPQKIKIFIISTIGLFFINFYFLCLMTIEFIKFSSPMNFGFLILDVTILTYYCLMIKLCYMTNLNKNIQSSTFINFI